MSDTGNPFEAFGGLGSEDNVVNPFAQAQTLKKKDPTGSPLVDMGGGIGEGNPFTTIPEASATESTSPLVEIPTMGGENENSDVEAAEESEEGPDEGDEDERSAAGDSAADEEVENPLMEQIENQEKQSIFDKLPVFVHGAAKEEIQDIDQTFDALRQAKAVDFPELEDAKRVTWDITYGAIRKSITSNDAGKKKIGAVKKEIETSKEFTDKLKKSKDKNPTCEVKPRVTMQSKGEGVPTYKGVFNSVDEAENSGKLICLVPGNDGKVYEIRNEESGRFVTPAGETKGLSEIEAGFTPALPLIGNHQLMEIVAFFRSFISTNGTYEAIANVLWDRYDEEFVTVIPKQHVSSVTARSDLSEAIDAERYLHYMDIHSHNVMPARFSATDDRDEKATRLYAVIGCLDKYFPEISVRISNGGKYQIIDPTLVFEEFDVEYPNEWNAQVETEKIGFTRKEWGEAA